MPLDFAYILWPAATVHPKLLNYLKGGFAQKQNFLLTVPLVVSTHAQTVSILIAHVFFSLNHPQAPKTIKVNLKPKTILWLL